MRARVAGGMNLTPGRRVAFASAWCVVWLAV
jgi:hypothetical protein